MTTGSIDDQYDEELLDAELTRLTSSGGLRAGLLDELVELEAYQRRAQARQQQVLATLSRLSPFPEGDLPPGAEALDDDRHAIHAAALETSVLLGIAPGTAKGRLLAARELVEQHPDLHAALASGVLDWWRAKLILDALRPLPEDTAREVEAQILSDAPTLTVRKLLERLRRLVITADPRDAAQRHADARKARRVTTRPVEHGMWQLFGELPAEDLAVVDEILDRVADALRDADPDDGRTMAQRRADALVRICDDVARTGHTGGCQPGCGHEPAPTDDNNDADAAGDDDRDNTDEGDDAAGDDERHDSDEGNENGGDGRDDVADDKAGGVGDRGQDGADEPSRPDTGHADDDGYTDEPDARGGGAFIRRDDRAGGAAGCPDDWTPVLRVRDRVGRPHIQVTVSWTTLAGLDDLPARLAGYGPITADQARTLAADGVWRRLLTDPISGVLLDYGRDLYRPPQVLRDFVRTRDVTSTFPTDNAPAHRAEIDHAQAWEDGGATDADNCHALSGWINRAKSGTAGRPCRCPTARCAGPHPPESSPTGHPPRSDPPTTSNARPPPASARPHPGWSAAARTKPGSTSSDPNGPPADGSPPTRRPTRTHRPTHHRTTSTHPPSDGADEVGNGARRDGAPGTPPDPCRPTRAHAATANDGVRSARQAPTRLGRRAAEHAGQAPWTADRVAPGQGRLVRPDGVCGRHTDRPRHGAGVARVRLPGAG